VWGGSVLRAPRQKADKGDGQDSTQKRKVVTIDLMSRIDVNRSFRIATMGAAVGLFWSLSVRMAMARFARTAIVGEKMTESGS
jgi:hypothetical protein